MAQDEWRPLQKMDIMLKLMGNNGTLSTSVVPFATQSTKLQGVLGPVPTGREEEYLKQSQERTMKFLESDIDVERASFQELKKRAHEVFSTFLQGLEDTDWCLGYLNPQWGNEALQITNDNDFQSKVVFLKQHLPENAPRKAKAVTDEDYESDLELAKDPDHWYIV
ncbi:hypothetical protein SLS60_009815 [Paraconiothyrium brasiliense]|uniref:Uncharacterized protein n=1 Tax=Paraconiothyrium brasiliense TaxID=300254 RepID=A0ABR3QSZ5_9PLEO